MYGGTGMIEYLLCYSFAFGLGFVFGYIVSILVEGALNKVIGDSKL